MNLKRAICPFLLSSVIVGLSSCSGESDQAGQSPETVRKLSVLAVQPARVPDLLETVGTVSAAQTSSLASQIKDLTTQTSGFSSTTLMLLLMVGLQRQQQSANTSVVYYSSGGYRHGWW